MKSSCRVVGVKFVNLSAKLGSIDNRNESQIIIESKKDSCQENKATDK